MPTRRHVLAGALAATLGGCAGTDSTETPVGSPPATDPGDLGYTHQLPTGNRLVAGEGGLPVVDPLDVAIPGEPAWLVGVPADRGSAWAVVTADGMVEGIRLDGRAAERFPLEPGALPEGTPPLLRGGDPPRVVAPPNDETSTLTHPVPVDEGWLAVSEGGDVVLLDGPLDDRELGRVAVDAPTDARIVTPDRRSDRAAGRAYVLADATDRYDHAVLGDGVEAGSVAVLDTSDGLTVEQRVRPPGSGVVEGLAPMLADVTGDGRHEVVVTVSGDGGGARVAAYRPDGTRVAAGPTLAGGWRHSLAVASFAPDGTPEIAAVRMPHVAHELQFFRREDDELRVVAAATGYRSHRIGSRNLDAALAGDLDGDGRLEVLVPTTNPATLAAVRRTADGAEEAWTVPLGGSLTTNLGAVTVGDDVTVAAGFEGTVRFWPSG